MLIRKIAYRHAGHGSPWHTKTPDRSIRMLLLGPNGNPLSMRSGVPSEQNQEMERSFSVCDSHTAQWPGMPMLNPIQCIPDCFSHPGTLNALPSLRQLSIKGRPLPENPRSEPIRFPSSGLSSCQTGIHQAIYLRSSAEEHPGVHSARRHRAPSCRLRAVPCQGRHRSRSPHPRPDRPHNARTDR